MSDQWSISHKAGIGRVLVARQDISPDMVVVEDTALVETPDGFPACLAILDSSSVPCPGCGWRVCNIEFAQADVIREECKNFGDKKVVPSMNYVHYFLPHGLYLVVVVYVLRVLLVTRDVEKCFIVENWIYGYLGREM